ncbi:bifunctional UDP-N-acetylglucosamine diphosphorylase/glucosamine-1-phosphate N-acetyltransferase GlmU [Wansuia hejianensis]|uniref:Bifunctional protein GlmU n=1 Tax=Wansuia hejianensis TaxID=2763667 RepID=A0A926F0Q2_9FIRM|nr:bifunctional UDP-N-acetylglucosamine diphosphorylase/glucosamine-1-phosphate N-acetyltransferase GlmU [Wansuia hejianensis]MBC8591231.1 bifunctional UDP-N-acetylglucosamine diphosphorylase/glucosamine-1-phosphate N-acetyltransferase GlmU [Wansuia hejianensis]
MNVSIILAAGEGTRMKSKLPKVLHKVCGKPILEYIINASKGANVEKNVVIVGHGSEKVKEYFKEDDIIFREQPVGEGLPYGTGFAVMQGIEFMGEDSTVVVLCGDTPLIREDTIDKFIQYHEKGNYDGTVLTALLDDPTGYGRIKRDNNGHISKIIEHKDASEEERNIKEINSGIYCFNGKLLKESLSKINNNNSQGELYITDVIGILNEEGYKVGAYIVEDSMEIHGINSRVQLAFSEEIMKRRINEHHMENGVTILDPNTTYIERGVTIGSDTIIYPGVTLEGNTSIGEDCIIRSNTRITNSKIRNGVTIESSVIEDSVVEEHSTIGPNAHLRPQSHIGKRVKIGNFVEVKKSYIGDNSKAGHLAYIGDANVGKDVNIGCGVIFANYDGKNKHRTNVGDNAFIGSNSNLIAPLDIEDWAYVAAGSTIINKVNEGALSIARAPQVNKEGWVDKKGFKNIGK